MTDQEAFEIVRSALFQNGSCEYNKWYTIVINGKPMFEAMINQKNYIHIRKPIKKVDWYVNRNDVYLYACYRFTSKKELVANGIKRGIRPDKENVRRVSL